jgi:hypothetical protein
MPSQIATVGDAVVAFINGLTLSQSFEAERRYAPDEDFSNPDVSIQEILADLHVMVWSTTRARSFTDPLATRTHPSKRYTVHIGVMQAIPQGSQPDDTTGNAFIDALALLCEEIEDAFTTGAAVGAFRLLPDDTELAIDAEAVRRKLFMGVITLAFRAT